MGHPDDGGPYRTSARTEGPSGPGARGPGRVLLACGTLGLLYVDDGRDA